MTRSTIYSIGHGNKKIEDFISQLNSFEINYLIDIRSMPFSKYNHQFNQHELKLYLHDKGITYLFLGDKLGGLPDDKSCYKNGKVDYEILKGKNYFQEGLQRLINVSVNENKSAIMCSESKPQECHRSKLIGRELAKLNISFLHIIAKGKTKSQETVILEATKGTGETDLFGDTCLTSRKKYH